MSWPYKNRGLPHGCTEARRRPSVSWEGPQEGTASSTPCSQTSSLRNCDTRRFCGWNRVVCGALFWQPWQASTGWYMHTDRHPEAPNRSWFPWPRATRSLSAMPESWRESRHLRNQSRPWDCCGSCAAWPTRCLRWALPPGLRSLDFFPPVWLVTPSIHRLRRQHCGRSVKYGTAVLARVQSGKWRPL